MTLNVPVFPEITGVVRENMSLGWFAETVI